MPGKERWMYARKGASWETREIGFAWIYLMRDRRMAAMRCITLVLMVIFFAMFSAVVVRAQEAKADETMAVYLRFDGNTESAMGPLTVSKSATGTVTFTEGKFGQAALINAKGTVIAYEWSPRALGSKYTISLWVKSAEGETAVEKRCPFLSDNLNLIYVDTEKKALVFELATVEVPKGVVPAVAKYEGFEWPSKEWQHIAAQADLEKKEIKLFVNAKEVASAKIGEKSEMPQAGIMGGLFIGGSAASEEPTTAIDDLRLYRRVLSADEIKKAAGM